MNKTILLKNCDTPFIIKDVSARTANAIFKKNRNLLGIINGVTATEDLVFACLVSPSYDSKEQMLAGLTPGQYLQLSNAVMALNGYEEGKKDEN